MPPIPKNELYRHIGTHIRQRRKDWSIDRWQLADATGLTLGELQALEDGQTNITISTLNDIAYQLQVPIGYFFKSNW